MVSPQARWGTIRNVSPVLGGIGGLSLLLTRWNSSARKSRRTLISDEVDFG